LHEGVTEFNASSRALKILKTDGYLKDGSDELRGAEKVLKAAA
jgi:Zn-dependent membrane protease YugP